MTSTDSNIDEVAVQEGANILASEVGEWLKISYTVSVYKSRY